MKRFLTSIVAVVALSAVVTGPAHAQIKLDKDRDVLGLLTIKSFDTTRHIGSLKAVIESAAAQPLEATYTFSRWDGKAWTTIGITATVTVPAKKTAEVTAFFRRSADAERLRLVVTNTVHKVNQVKELRLAAVPAVPVKETKFVVTYRTSKTDWALAADHNGAVDRNKLRAADAEKLAKALRALGFEARIDTTVKQSVSGDTERNLVWARAATAQTRTFDNRAAAEEFQLILHALVRDDRPLVTRISEE